MSYVHLFLVYEVENNKKWIPYKLVTFPFKVHLFGTDG